MGGRERAKMVLKGKSVTRGRKGREGVVCSAKEQGLELGVGELVVGMCTIVGEVRVVWGKNEARERLEEM